MPADPLAQSKVPHDRGKVYRDLRALDLGAYKKAIEYAGALSLNYHFDLMAAEEVERSFIGFALELLRAR